MRRDEEVRDHQRDRAALAGAGEQIVERAARDAARCDEQVREREVTLAIERAARGGAALAEHADELLVPQRLAWEGTDLVRGSITLEQRIRELLA
ncbi:MAG: hypothetical protein M3680_09525 [Myxococcota bacterium]|nr:hypothetical protein [Myxococcota bacterium]